MLQAYRFEHPNDKNRFAEIDGWSYVWSGVFGSFYLGAKGFHRHLAKAVLIDVAFVAVLAAAFAIGFLMRPAVIQWIAVAVVVPIAVLVHGAAMIGIMRVAYRRRGWKTLML